MWDEIDAVVLQTQRSIKYSHFEESEIHSLEHWLHDLFPSFPLKDIPLRFQNYDQLQVNNWLLRGLDRTRQIFDIGTLVYVASQIDNQEIRFLDKEEGNLWILNSSSSSKTKPSLTFSKKNQNQWIILDGKVGIPKIPRHQKDVLPFIDCLLLDFMEPWFREENHKYKETCTSFYQTLCYLKPNVSIYQVIMYPILDYMNLSFPTPQNTIDFIMYRNCIQQLLFLLGVEYNNEELEVKVANPKQFTIPANFMQSISKHLKRTYPSFVSKIQMLQKLEDHRIKLLSFLNLSSKSSCPFVDVLHRICPEIGSLPSHSLLSEPDFLFRMMLVLFSTKYLPLHYVQHFKIPSQTTNISIVLDSFNIKQILASITQPSFLTFSKFGKFYACLLILPDRKQMIFFDPFHQFESWFTLLTKLNAENEIYYVLENLTSLNKPSKFGIAYCLMQTIKHQNHNFLFPKIDKVDEQLYSDVSTCMRVYQKLLQQTILSKIL